ncbi:MAG: Ig-like domain-containing protein [Pirellulales bacterium]
MTSRNSRSFSAVRRKQKQARPNPSLRKLLGQQRKSLELLEDRAMMAAGPYLAGIQPNVGDLLPLTSLADNRYDLADVGTIGVLSTSPRELRLAFNEGQTFATEGVRGIQITRAGSDRLLGTADDVTVMASNLSGFQGFVGSDASPNENVVVVRFPETLPDDLYRVQIFGIDNSSQNIVALRNSANEAFVPAVAGADRQTIDFKLSLGAQVVAVVPQPTVSNATGTISQSLNQIEVYFNDDDLWPTPVKTGQLSPDPSVVKPEFYRLIFTQDSARNVDDVVFTPNMVEYDPVANKATLTFNRNRSDFSPVTSLNELKDPTTGLPIGYGTWRLRIGTNEETPAPPVVSTPTASLQHDFGTSEAVKVQFDAQHDFGTAVSVVYNNAPLGLGAPPVVTVVGQSIFVTLNNDPSTPTTALQLVTALTNNTAAFALVNATVPVGNPNTPIASSSTATKTLRLAGLGSSFDTATNIGKLDLTENQHQLLQSSIDPQSFPFAYPGDKDEPGHRDLPDEAGHGYEQHINYDFGVDTQDGVQTIKYNFRSAYGSDPLGNTLSNVITENQKQRVREALELWARYLGVQFYETANEGLTMATGDLRALNTNALDVRRVTNGVVRVDPNYANSLLVLDTNTTWNDTFGDTYFQSAMQGVGYMLGLGSSPELPAANELVFPNDNDVIHGQLVHRPDSNDIDVYKFTVDLGPGKTGVFSAEAFAERQTNSSLLDTVLRLYREIPATAAVAQTDFNSGGAVSVRFTAVNAGGLGNEFVLSFSKTDRGVGAPPLVVVVGSTISIDLNATPGSETTAQQLINAVAANADAAARVRAELVSAPGTANTNLAQYNINYSPLNLTGGADVRREVVAQNDDYYSKDSFLKVTLSGGTYYLGVSAAGNENYDPTIEDTGAGGRTQGTYQLQVDFRPQVDADDAIRDMDRRLEGLPGTPLDGDADGTAGGLYNFWFQTRDLQRVLEVVGTGGAFSDGQIVTITNFGGVVRRFEFNTIGGVGAGNVPVNILAGDSADVVADKLVTAINSANGFNTTFATRVGTKVRLSGDRTVALSSGMVGIRVHGKTIFVNKTAGPSADGSLARPFNNISSPTVPNAFANTLPGDIVRIVGNGGSDNNYATSTDNFAYEIGFGSLPGQLLTDGTTMEVPKGVTVMVDAGAIFKLRAARIAVGSSTLGVDRSGSAMQVLGTPERNVYFTSWFDESLGRDTFGTTTFPDKGNWGGIIFQNDLDHAKGRDDYEAQGIFLNYVNHADFRYGGGIVNIDSNGLVVQPIQMIEARPTVTFNSITSSADSAMSADPDSFEETQFNTPEYQLSGAFTPEYGRVGPEIHGNRLSNNSINGLFVRISTPSGAGTKVLSTQGRFDDTDIVHYIPENLEIHGTPGGPLQDTTTLPVNLITLTPITAGFLAAGTYSYRFTLVDASGYEAPPSAATTSAVLASTGGIRLNNLPIAPSGYVARRIYRSADGVNYELAAAINASDLTYFDNGKTLQGALDTSVTSLLRPRLDGRLAVDPGTVVKLEGSRIEVSFGGQLIAEGRVGQEIIFTSKLDDRFGAGGTFDTNNDNAANPERQPNPGDWGGIYVGHTSRANFDHSLIAYGGGITKLEGTFKAFNALEVHQGDLRLVNSVVEQNSTGIGGQGPTLRLGRLDNRTAVLFARGTQPVVVNNIFRNNDNQTVLPTNPDQAVISIDVNSLSYLNVTDPGRETGDLDRFDQFETNSGPLVRLNRLARNGINGMWVRGGTLATEGIWDDTDIVHVVLDTVTVPNFHTYGGLRLQSSSTESLVVKLLGTDRLNGIEGGWGFYDKYLNTGLTATGTPLDIDDRIGGVIHVIGQPGHPVVLTSFHDDTIGAGLQPDNTPQTDTNNNGIGTIPRPGDWRSILLDQNSHDRNVELIMETETPGADAPGNNATPQTAQVLGTLAPGIQGGDENLRLGFEVHGYLNDPRDVDVYSFIGYAGTEVWLDIDRTNGRLDSIVELLNANGEVVARSDNSLAESQDGTLLFRGTDVPPQYVNNLIKSPANQRDFGTLNSRDAGMRVVLPGTIGTQSTFHFRIRSNGPDLDRLDGGLTEGNYIVELRMQETDEVPGSIVRYADIRYATTGVEAYGLPAHSPLSGEVTEDSEVASTAVMFGPEQDNNDITPTATLPGSGPQYIGNLLATDRSVMSIGGSLTGYNDVDFYEFQVNYTPLSGAAGPPLYLPTVFDVDYADGFTRPNTSLAIFNNNQQLVLIGRDSNVAEDRARPLSGSDLDDLSRGSGGAQDPFIGVVDLPATSASYYVAVHHNQQIPAELTQFTSLDTAFPLVRLEPVNSVRRIAEDHIGSFGGSTADSPVVQVLLDPSFVGTGSNLWHVTNFEPATAAGHGLNPTFDGSRAVGSGRVFDNEGNDTLATAQDLDGAQWSTAFDTLIGDQTVNTSTTIPHITVVGRGDGTRDYYTFNVPTNGARVLLDIDQGSTGQPGTINTLLRLYNSAGTLLSTNDDAPTTYGSGGSSSVQDAYIDTAFPSALVLPAGDYVVEVAQSGGAAPASGQQYTLQVSVQNHLLGGVAAGGGASFAFRNAVGGGFDTGGPGTGVLQSNPFSLSGYSADDQPTLYFTYFLETGSAGDQFRVYANDGVNRVLLASSVAADYTVGDVRRLFDQRSLGFNQNWRQARVDLGRVAGLDNIRLEFEFQADGTFDDAFAAGAFVDDVIIGFAERGEMVTRPTSAFGSDPTFVNNPLTSEAPPGELASGAYQLEMRRGVAYATSQDPTPVRLRLDTSFDTNDRLAGQVVLQAADGASINDTETFDLGDGISRLTFEFDSDGTWNLNNVRVPFQTTDSAATIAARIRDLVNSDAVRGVLTIQAASADGTVAAGVEADNRVNLFGNVVLEPATGSAIQSVRNNYFGDSNVYRDQGQLLIHSNFITDSRDWGVIIDAGTRDTEPGRQVPYMQSHQGPVRKFPALNNRSGDNFGTNPSGGLVAGAVVQNNVIEGEGLGGIHVSGNVAPLEITVRDPADIINCPAPNGTVNGLTSGDRYRDGETFVLQFGDRTQTFEFEDVAGGSTTAACFGSGAGGGNGYGAGNIPIFFRQTTSAGPGYSSSEMAAAIRDAIVSSWFTMNGTTYNVDDTRVESSRMVSLGGLGGFGGTIPAVYVEHMSNWDDDGLILQGYMRRLPIGLAPVPFVRVVNNTILGDNGQSAFNPEPNNEPNETISQAIDTKQGRQMKPLAYTSNASIGDNPNFRLDPSLDVDFYRFQLDVGDRVTIDIDTAVGPAQLNSFLRVFDEVGLQVAANDNAAAPGEGGGTDSYIDFTATRTGTYYVAVSGAGNQSYDPNSLSGRATSATRGAYTINVDVSAPREAYILVDRHAFGTGEAFEVIDVAGNRVVFEFGSANIPGSITVPNGFTRRPDQAEALAAAINAAGLNRLTNVQNLPNGPFANANPISRVRARAFGGPDGFDPITNGPTRGGTRDTQGNGLNFRANSAGLYVELQYIAEIRVLNGPITVGPTQTNNTNDWFRQSGVLVTERASPTLLNNIIENQNRGFLNVQVGEDMTSFFTFTNSSVVAATVFQYMSQLGGVSLNTFDNTHVFNPAISAAGIDFNIELSTIDPLLNNAPDRNYYPLTPSRIIDSAVNVLEDRDDFATRIKAPLGLAPSAIFAPALDATGTKRIDNPNVSSPQGQGENVFKDRGALDLADFVTPTAELLVPRDNDALGVDHDPAATVVQLVDGVYPDFKVQIQDQFGADNPFPGTSALDDTIQTMPVQVDEDGLQLTLNGPAVTLFEDGRFLKEGFDYTFRYDGLTDTIVLTPLAGIWPDGRVYEIRLNNRDRFVIDAPNGGSILDGSSFVVTDRTGARITLEFESGYRLQVPQTLTIQVPVAGAGTGGISDGQKFSINDGKRSVTFEFDSNNLNTAGTRRVPFAVGDSQNAIANAIVLAIQQAVTANALTGIAPENLGNGVVHAGATPAASYVTAGSTLSTNLTQYPTGLVVPAVGLGLGGIADGQTFRITNQQSGVTETYEFDDLVNNPGVAGTNIAVPFVPTATPDDLASAIALTISINGTGIAATNVGNGRVAFVAQPFHQVDVSQTNLTRTMYIGGVGDGESLLVRYTGGPTQVRTTFEFDLDGALSVPGSTPIVITSADSQEDIAAKITAALDTPNLALDPINFGQGNVHVGGTTQHFLDASKAPSLNLTGQPGVKTASRIQLPVSQALQIPSNGGLAIPDGEKFVISNGVIDVTFEFDSDFVFEDADNDLVPDNVVIPYAVTSTQDQVAAAVLQAVANAGLGLTPPFTNNPINGLVILGTNANHTVTLAPVTNLSSSLIVSGLVDGEAFTIDDGLRAQRFEFEDATISDGVTAGSTPIFFTPRSNADDVANAVVAIVQNAGLCTNFGDSCLGTTANLGGGVIELGDTGRHTTTLRTNSRLVLSGVPGGAVPVVYQPDVSFTDARVAQAIIAAIEQATTQQINVIAGHNPEYRLVGVDASLRGGSTVFLDFLTADGKSVDFTSSPAGVAGISSFFLQGIRDVAGNLLRGNQPSNNTQFTILMPGVDLDFGDSPDPFTGPGRYPTQAESDGARHTISQTNPLFLGSFIDADSAGQATPQANGDDTDLMLDLSFSAGLSQSGPAGQQLLTVGSRGLDGLGNRLANVSDGETFQIFDGNTTQTFEFDSNDDVRDDRTIILFTSSSTVEEIANKIVDAIRRADLAIRATSLGNGDIQLSSDDDDGVVFHSVFNQYLDTPFTVTASGAGFLDAWIDYNQDGDWEDPGEHLFNAQPVVAGANDFVLRTPTGASIGDTFARFRLSTTGGLLPSGLAVGGEVEDYRITVLGGQPPVAVNDPRTVDRPLYATVENTAIAVPAGNGLLANDSDPDSVVINVSEVNGSAAAVGALIAIASGAQIQVQANGSFAYDPRTSLLLDALPAGQTFQDTFTYRVSDGLLPSGLATVTITVTGQNDPPQANDNAYNLDEDTLLGGTNLITDNTGVGADRDPDTGDIMSLREVNGAPIGGTSNVSVTLPSGATLTLLYNSTVGRFDGNFLYDPRTSNKFQKLTAAQTDSDSFTYTIADGTGATSLATVSLTITGRNDAPTTPTRTYAVQEDVVLSGSNLLLDAPAASDPDDQESATLKLTGINGTAVPAVGGVVVTLPSGAILTVNSQAGGFSYDGRTAFNSLRLGQTANDIFTYSVTDTHGATAIGTVTMTITGQNDAPTAVTNAYATNDNATVTGRNLVTDNSGSGVDSDPDTGDTLSLGAVAGQLVTGTSNRTIVLPSGATFTAVYSTTLGRFDGSFVYDPSTSATLNGLQVGQSGSDTFTYSVKDAAGALSSPITVTITVTGANDAPVASPNGYATDEDTSLAGNVVSDPVADFDPDTGDTAILRVVAVNGVAGNVGLTIPTANGANLRVTDTGALTYDPRNSSTLQALTATQTGTDTFTYTISDSRGGLSTATVTITVQGRNDNPTARANAYTTDDNTPISGKNIVTESPADTDPDAGETALLQVSAVNGGGAGSVGTPVLTTKGATVTVSATGQLTYDPTTSATLNALTIGQSTTDTFSYTVRDPQGGTSTATVTITIVGANDPPVATPNSYTVSENSAITTANVLTDAPPDSDPDTGDSRTVTAINGVNGSVGQNLTTANGARLIVSSTGAVTYNPTISATLDALTTGQQAIDTFTYTITDSRGATATATVTITVTGFNDAPGALNDDVTVNQDTSTAINVLANDSDPEGPLSTGTVVVVTNPGHGTATVNPDKTIQYTPAAGYVGADGFTYRVTDSQGASSVATVTITVRATPSLWQNPARPMDVNADTFVTPLDALLLINDINNKGARTLAGQNPPTPLPAPYIDPDGNGRIESRDVLLVIDAINQASGEAEAVPVDSGAEDLVGATTSSAFVLPASGVSTVLVDHRWSPQDTISGGVTENPPISSPSDEVFALSVDEEEENELDGLSPSARDGEATWQAALDAIATGDNWLEF